MKSKTHQPRTLNLQQANGGYSMLESTKEHNIVKPLKHLLPMRTFVMSLLMLLCSIGLSAQFVTIPDANFRANLQQRFPACFNANGEMDITCNAVVSATRIDIAGYQISDLDGVQYFANLEELYCERNQLTNLPTLPNSLLYLDCYQNQLMSLPVLPSNLQSLNCHRNQLTSLPQLPSSLTEINCNSNLITTLPIISSNASLLHCDSNLISTLPVLPNMIYLSCSHNQLTSLPTLSNSLRELYCNNNQLTSLPVLPNSLQSIYCHYNQLSSLPALPSNLDGLVCKNNQLTSLPALPSSLRYIDCCDNQLTSLPALPNGFVSLACDDNQLTNLPALPSSLQILSINNNRLTSLPALPNGLIGLECNNNQLTSIPAALPSGMTNLECGGNYQITSLPALPSTLIALKCDRCQLTSLPALPSGLLFLFCGYNQLTSLPLLPSSLQIFACHSNQLTSLPALPNGLVTLNCFENQLTTLPTLPDSLQNLWCGYNQLTSLPALPSSLTELECSYNQLASLPELPNRLVTMLFDGNLSLTCLPLLPNTLSANYFSVTGTSISCLPNYTQNINQALTGLPLCTNPSQICQTSPMAGGVVYNDDNNNGTREANESLAGGVPVMVSPNNWTGISDAANGYFVNLDALPTVNTIAPGALPYRTFTPSSYSVTATNIGLLPTSYDFAMQSQQNITDLVTRISTWFIRPGFQTSANVNVENIGTVDQSNATVYLEIPSGLSVISVLPANGVVNGNMVTWSGESFQMLERRTYSVSLQVPVNMTLGASVAYTAQAIPATTDFTPADNIITETVVVRGSYDPNDKQVNKERLANNYVAADEELLYNIRFQNTGTDTAFTVVVRDTLDLGKLDFSTFRVTGASHSVRTVVREHGVVEFFFNNINLVDSFANEAASHGFVQFSIHPKAGLAPGTEIRNRAFIYFDFNAPIITNYATTTIGLLSLSSDELLSGSLSLYPVPVSGPLTVNFSAKRSGEMTYRLLDLQGRLLQSHQLTVSEGENVSQMDLSGLPAGMYMLQVLGEEGSLSQKLVKE